jgi:hypothetical protein
MAVIKYIYEGYELTASMSQCFFVKQIMGKETDLDSNPLKTSFVFNTFFYVALFGKNTVRWTDRSTAGHFAIAILILLHI